MVPPFFPSMGMGAAESFGAAAAAVADTASAPAKIVLRVGHGNVGMSELPARLAGRPYPSEPKIRVFVPAALDAA